MKTHLLFPRSFRPAGLLLAPLFYWLMESDVTLSIFQKSEPAIARIKSDSFVYSENSSGDVWMVGLVISLLFVAFSRLKQEDEYTMHLRLHALMESVYINFALAAALIFFTNGMQFLFMAALHSMALLIVFSLLFYGRMLLRRSVSSQESA